MSNRPRSGSRSRPVSASLVRRSKQSADDTAILPATVSASRAPRPVSALLHPTASRQPRFASIHHDAHQADAPSVRKSGVPAVAAALPKGSAGRQRPTSTHVAAHDVSATRRRPMTAMTRSNSSVGRANRSTRVGGDSTSLAGSARLGRSTLHHASGEHAAASNAVEEMFSLCEQLQLPAATLSAMTYAAEDPTTRSEAVAQLRSHKSTTLAALRIVDGRERVLRCYEDIAADAMVATPRTKSRLEGEKTAVAEALATTTQQATEAIEAWLADRQQIYGGEERSHYLRGDKELTFTWRGVDYLRKMERDQELMTQQRPRMRGAAMATRHSSSADASDPFADDRDAGTDDDDDEIVFEDGAEPADHNPRRISSNTARHGAAVTRFADSVEPIGLLALEGASAAPLPSQLPHGLTTPPRRGSSFSHGSAAHPDGRSPTSHDGDAIRSHSSDPRSRRSPSPLRQESTTSAVNKGAVKTAAAGAAAAIQRAWRCHVARERAWYARLRLSSALQLQRWYRNIRRARMLLRHALKAGRSRRRRPGKSRTTMLGVSPSLSLRTTPAVSPAGFTALSGSTHGSPHTSPMQRSLTKREELENEAIAAEAWLNIAAGRITRFFRGLNTAKAKAIALATREERELRAAVVIQAWLRPLLQRGLQRRRRTAATRMQALARGHLARVAARERALSRDSDAASSLLPSSSTTAGASTLVFVAGASAGEPALQPPPSVVDAVDGDVVIDETSTVDPDYTLSPVKGAVRVEPSVEAAAAQEVEDEADENNAEGDTNGEAHEAVTQAAVEFVSPTRMPFPLRLRRVIRPDGPETYPVFGADETNSVSRHRSAGRRRRDPTASTAEHPFGPFWAGDFEAAVTIQSAWRRHVAVVCVTQRRTQKAETEATARAAQRKQHGAVVIQQYARSLVSQLHCVRKPSVVLSAVLTLQRWCRELHVRGKIGPLAGDAIHAHEDDALLFMPASRPTPIDATREQSQRRTVERWAARVVGEWFWRRLRHWSFVGRLRESSVRNIQRAWKDYVLRRDYCYRRHQRKLAERNANDRSARIIKEAEALRQLAEDETEIAAWRVIHDTTLERIEHINEEIRKRPDRNVAATRIQCAWRSAVAREERTVRIIARHSRWAHVAVDENTADAATRIQAQWRRHLQRGRLPRHRAALQRKRLVAAVKIQSLARGWLVRLRRHRDTVTSSPAFKAAQRQRQLLAELEPVPLGAPL